MRRPFCFLLILSASVALAKGPKMQKNQPETKGVAKTALAGPMKHVEEIVFAVRQLSGDLHFYENYGRAGGRGYRHAPPPGRLCRMNLRNGKVTTILEDLKGNMRDPIVHYDGKKILFSYRKGGTNHYHLYEINIDGSGLKQLTDGDYDDVEPTYLPNGDIIFISSRGDRRVPCWSTEVGLLHRCRGDGSRIRGISGGIEHENTPWMLPDGRILYMRWEYVDRSEIDYHHLWSTYPDGSKQMTYFGNMHSYGNIAAMLDAKPIPNSPKIVTTYTFHNTAEHAGDLVIVDPRHGPDHKESGVYLNHGYAPRQAKKSKYNAEAWRDPYPFSEDCFLVAASKRICIMNGKGEYETIYELKDGPERLWVHEPRPLVPRDREPIIADTWNWQQPTGTLVLSDVRIGRKMDGVKRGEIKKLLVMEELPKPASYGASMTTESLWSTFILHRILGTVPVEEDGSAYFDLPANRALFFVALDEKGNAVKRMMSFVNVVPGEVTGCVGCHEQRTLTPPSIGKLALAATLKPPQRITPLKGIPEVIDYQRDVQPIWNKHCVSCHNYDKYAGKLSLTGDRAPIFTHSYLNLEWKGLVSHGEQGKGNRKPYSIGAVASKLVQTLKKPHHNVKLSEREMLMIEMWIESSVAYSGTYAGLGRGKEIRVDIPKSTWKDRCVSCHKNELRNRWTTGWGRVLARKFNLTHPEKSLALLAPLAKDAGGLGLCLQRDAHYKTQGEPGTPANVFKSKEDPDYQKILTVIKKAAAKIDKRDDHLDPKYKPPGAYLEVMQRLNCLPPGKTPGKDKIDWFQVDETYYRKFRHTPGQNEK